MLTLCHSDYKYLTLLHILHTPLLQPQVAMPQRIVPTLEDHILSMYLNDVNQTNSKIKHLGQVYVVTD
jgi:hypothetical protein